jgi:hypothetical protein
MVAASHLNIVPLQRKRTPDIPTAFEMGLLGIGTVAFRIFYDLRELAKPMVDRQGQERLGIKIGLAAIAKRCILPDRPNASAAVLRRAVFHGIAEIEACGLIHIEKSTTASKEANCYFFSERTEWCKRPENFASSNIRQGRPKGITKKKTRSSDDLLQNSSLPPRSPEDLVQINDLEARSSDDLVVQNGRNPHSSVESLQKISEARSSDDHFKYVYVDQDVEVTKDLDLNQSIEERNTLLRRLSAIDASTGSIPVELPSNVELHFNPELISPVQPNTVEPQSRSAQTLSGGTNSTKVKKTKRQIDKEKYLLPDTGVNKVAALPNVSPEGVAIFEAWFPQWKERYRSVRNRYADQTMAAIHFARMVQIQLEEGEFDSEAELYQAFWERCLVWNKQTDDKILRGDRCIEMPDVDGFLLGRHGGEPYWKPCIPESEPPIPHAERFTAVWQQAYAEYLSLQQGGCDVSPGSHDEAKRVWAMLYVDEPPCDIEALIKFYFQHKRERLGRSGNIAISKFSNLIRPESLKYVRDVMHQKQPSESNEARPKTESELMLEAALEELRKQPIGGVTYG